MQCSVVDRCRQYIQQNQQQSFATSYQDNFSKIATYLINSYQQSGRVFVTGGIELSSDEGTTQGDPGAMSMYSPLSNCKGGSITKFSIFFLRLQFITTPIHNPICEDFEKI